MYLSICIEHFPAQAFAAYNPQYRNKPFVVVQQNASSYKSEALACSRKAIESGVRAGDRIRQLRKDLANLLVIPRREDLEETAREDLAAVIEVHTPVFEFDRGECLLNLTGVPFLRSMGENGIADRIREDMRKKIGLESIGIGISKHRLLARLLGQAAMPGENLISESGKEMETLLDLEAEFLPGLTERTREKIQKYGWKSIGQIAYQTRRDLTCRLGPEGELVYSLCKGFDTECTIALDTGLWTEKVLKTDINDIEQLVELMRLSADTLSHKLRSGTRVTDRLTFKLTYADSRSVQKTDRLPIPTNSYRILSIVAENLFTRLYTRRVGIRSVRMGTVRTREDPRQLSLFETGDEKRERRRGYAVESIRTRMGFDRVVEADYIQHFGGRP